MRRASVSLTIILLTHDSPMIHHPDAPRLAVLTFHHPKNALHGRHVGSVASKSLIAEREALAVHDQRDHHLLTIRAMIARVSPAHHRVLFCRSFHVGAGQVIQQPIELSSE
jgi:hypothetical protein